MGMVEVERIIPPMLKPRLALPPEEDLNVGIGIDGMGVETLGKLMNGNNDTPGIPRIKGLVENGMDGVVPMELRGGKVEIMGIPPIPL
jgi:hypothetical protein